jgi:hypothetical protein
VRPETGLAAARPEDGKVWHLLITSLYRSDRVWAAMQSASLATHVMVSY